MRTILPKLTLFLFLLLPFYCHADTGGWEAGQYKSVAPDFKLADLGGNLISLADYKAEKEVLLFFWTTWCPACRTELKRLNAMSGRLAENNLEVFAVNVGEPKFRVENYAVKNSIGLKILLDEDSDTAYAYDVLGVPTFIFISRDGYVVSQGNSFPYGQYQEK